MDFILVMVMMSRAPDNKDLNGCKLIQKMNWSYLRATRIIFGT